MCCRGRGREMRHRMRTEMKERMGRGFGRRGRHRSSGNMAFDDYRDEVLRKLEEERDAFDAYIKELRRAKDQEEFERFRQAQREEAAQADSDIEDADADIIPPQTPPSTGGGARL